MLGLMLMSLMAAAADVPARLATGQFTATNGTVILHRDGRAFRAELRSALRSGDRLETTAGAGAGLFLYDGHALFLGPETAVTIAGGAQDERVRLAGGEVRATVSGGGGLTIATATARTRSARGILHVAVTPAGTRVWAERGEAEVTSRDRPPATVREGEEAFFTTQGESQGPTAATGAGWMVDPTALRLAGAAAESRRLKDNQITQANDDTAVAFQASGQTGTPPATGAGTDRANEPPGTPPTTPEGTTPTIAPTTTGDDTAAQPIAFAQTNSSFSTASSSIAFSGAAGAFSSAFSSGLGSDAQQDSRNPAFPGNIHLITAATNYNLNGVHLGPKDTLFPTTQTYFSIGLGAPPTKQVTTSFLTGTGATPITIPIPHFNAYLIELNQYNIIDPAKGPSNQTDRSGISGLLGANPASPLIQNATPLTDPRAVFNDRATFALGEFSLERTGQHGNIPQIELRRSDQDRQIIPLTLTSDKVTPNPDVSFVRQPDFLFFPEFKQGVYVPVQNSFKFPPNIAKLDLIRKAAVDTLLAATLLQYSHQTGQTQFAIGKEVFDITGYHLPKGYAAAVAPELDQAKVAAGSTRPRAPAVAATKGRGTVASRMPSLRSLGPRPEATRSGTSTGSGHGHGPQHH